MELRKTELEKTNKPIKIKRSQKCIEIAESHNNTRISIYTSKNQMNEKTSNHKL